MADKMITMLLIPDAGPWSTIFYMCGSCGEAIKLRDVEEHAREAHKADGVKLFEQSTEANEAQAAGEQHIPDGSTSIEPTVSGEVLSESGVYRGGRSDAEAAIAENTYDVQRRNLERFNTRRSPGYTNHHGTGGALDIGSIPGGEQFLDRSVERFGFEKDATPPKRVGNRAQRRRKAR